jgi:hypothetical protein
VTVSRRPGGRAPAATFPPLHPIVRTSKRKFLNIKTYDANAKDYTEYGISSFGESEYNKGGSIVGNKRTFLWDGDTGGKPARFRYTEVHVSPTLYTYKAEALFADEPWAVIGEGKITKVK